jgi:hypothetical protein
VGKAYLSKSKKSMIILLEPWFHGESFIIFIEDFFDLTSGRKDEIKLKSYMVPKEVVRR